MSSTACAMDSLAAAGWQPCPAGAHTADMLCCLCDSADRYLTALLFIAGCTAIIDNLIYALCDEGDGVLIPAPYYPAFDNDLQACCHRRCCCSLLLMVCCPCCVYARLRPAITSMRAALHLIVSAAACRVLIKSQAKCACTRSACSLSPALTSIPCSRSTHRRPSAACTRCPST